MTIFGHTARSGSTLLAQMLNRTKGTRSISEPWPLIYVRKGEKSFFLLYMGKNPNVILWFVSLQIASICLRKIISPEVHKRLLQSSLR